MPPGSPGVFFTSRRNISSFKKSKSSFARLRFLGKIFKNFKKEYCKIYKNYEHTCTIERSSYMDGKSSDITIGKTIEWYTALRDDVVGKSIRDMYDNAKKCAKEGEYVCNDTYFHALFLSEIMFSNTQKSLRILSGCDIVKFLRTLHDSFIACCKEIAKNNGIIRIVALTPSPEIFENCKAELREFFKEIREECPSIDGKIFGRLKILPSEIANEVLNGTNTTFSHYMVSDSKMLRIESPHGVLAESHPASSIKAKVFFNAPNAATDVANSFDTSYFSDNAVK